MGIIYPDDELFPSDILSFGGYLNAVSNIEDVVNYITNQIKSVGVNVVDLDELEECKTSGVSLFFTGGESFNGLCGAELYNTQNLVIQLKGGRKAINTLNQIEAIRQALHNVHDVIEGTTEIILIQCNSYVSISRKTRTDYSMIVSVDYKGV